VEAAEYQAFTVWGEVWGSGGMAESMNPWKSINNAVCLQCRSCVRLAMNVNGDNLEYTARYSTSSCVSYWPLPTVAQPWLRLKE